MRGTWFLEKGLDWVPLRETLADELETAFRSEVGLGFKLLCTCVSRAVAGRSMLTCSIADDAECLITVPALTHDISKLAGSEDSHHQVDMLVSQVWHPSHRHLAEQQQGLIAARVDLASSSQKVPSHVYVSSRSQMSWCVTSVEAASWQRRLELAPAANAPLQLVCISSQHSS